MRQQLADALLDRRDELARDRRRRRSRPRTRSRRRAAAAPARSSVSPNWPWPPVCFLCLPCASARPLIVSRYGTFGAFSSTSTPNLRFSRSTATSMWSWPEPETMISFVCSSRSTCSAVSSSIRRWRPCMTFSSSALLFGCEREGDRGRRIGQRRQRIGCFSSASVSPDAVSLSFATAMMSPAIAAGDLASASCPRAEELAEALLRAVAAALSTVESPVARPETTRSTESLPGERVDDGLEDEAPRTAPRDRRRARSASPVFGSSPVPRRQVGGRRQQVDDRVEQRDGRRCRAPPRRTSTGRNFRARAPVAEPAAQLVVARARRPRGTSRAARRRPRRPSRPAARARARPSSASSAGTRALLHRPRSRPGSVNALPGEQVDDAAKPASRADRQLQHGRLRAERPAGRRARGRRSPARGRGGSRSRSRGRPSSLAPRPDLLGLDLHLAAGRAEDEDARRSRRGGSCGCRAGSGE